MNGRREDVVADMGLMKFAHPRCSRNREPLADLPDKRLASPATFRSLGSAASASFLFALASRSSSAAWSRPFGWPGFLSDIVIVPRPTGFEPNNYSILSLRLSVRPRLSDLSKSSLFLASWPLARLLCCTNRLLTAGLCSHGLLQASNPDGTVRRRDDSGVRTLI